MKAVFGLSNSETINSGMASIYAARLKSTSLGKGEKRGSRVGIRGQGSGVRAHPQLLRLFDRFPAVGDAEFLEDSLKEVLQVSRIG